MPTTIATLRVMLFADSGQCVAQGIEFDIAAQGVTPEQAMDRFRLTLADELLLFTAGGTHPPAAPYAFVAIWERGDPDRWREPPPAHTPQHPQRTEPRPYGALVQLDVRVCQMTSGDLSSVRRGNRR